jgi:hypothetical protein
MKDPKGKEEGRKEGPGTALTTFQHKKRSFGNWKGK